MTKQKSVFRVTRASAKKLDSRSRAIFGAHLNGLMRERDLTQAELAALAFGRDAKGPIARDRVSKYLSGKTFPETASIDALCRGLDCSFEVLLPQAVRDALTAIDGPHLDLKIFMNGQARFKCDGMYPVAIIAAIYPFLQKAHDGRLPPFAKLKRHRARAA